MGVKIRRGMAVRGADGIIGYLTVGGSEQWKERNRRKRQQYEEGDEVYVCCDHSGL